jgi:hypothetical protein
MELAHLARLVIALSPYCCRVNKRTQLLELILGLLLLGLPQFAWSALAVAVLEILAVALLVAILTLLALQPLKVVVAA